MWRAKRFKELVLLKTKSHEAFQFRMAVITANNEALGSRLDSSQSSVS